MFLVLPVLLKRGLGFGPALILVCGITVILYLAMTWALARAGVDL